MARVKLAYLRFLRPGLLQAAARTVIYAVLCAFLGGEKEYLKPLIEASLVGGILADYLTWFLRSLVRLPGHVLEGCYETAINVVFGWYLLRHANLNLPADIESFSVAFLSFLFVAGVKTIYYAAESFASTDEQERREAS